MSLQGSISNTPDISVRSSLNVSLKRLLLSSALALVVKRLLLSLVVTLVEALD